MFFTRSSADDWDRWKVRLDTAKVGNKRVEEYKYTERGVRKYSKINSEGENRLLRKKQRMKHRYKSVTRQNALLQRGGNSRLERAYLRSFDASTQLGNNYDISFLRKQNS